MDPEVRLHALQLHPSAFLYFPRAFAPASVRPLLAAPRFSFSFGHEGSEHDCRQSAPGLHTAPIAQERHCPWQWAQWRSPGARMLRQVVCAMCGDIIVVSCELLPRQPGPLSLSSYPASATPRPERSTSDSRSAPHRPAAPQTAGITCTPDHDHRR